MASVQYIANKKNEEAARLRVHEYAYVCTFLLFLFFSMGIIFEWFFSEIFFFQGVRLIALPCVTGLEVCHRRGDSGCRPNERDHLRGENRAWEHCPYHT